MREVTFSKNLTKIKNALGYTQEQLGNYLGYERQTISNYERGKRLPSIDIVAKLSDLLKVSTDELIFGNVSFDILEAKNSIETLINNSYLSNLKKGFCCIIDTDIFERFPYIEFDLPLLMDIVIELYERKFDIREVFPNGFSLYLPDQTEVNRFLSSLSHIIDMYIHCDQTTCSKYKEKYDITVSEIESNIVNEVIEMVLKDKTNKKYYWKDSLDNVRGYADSKEECIEEARLQQCTHFDIFENE